MKPQLTLAFLLLFLSAALFGQTGVKFKVKILPDNTSFQVLVRPNFSASDVAIGASSQVTLRVPLGGFDIGNITNHLGNWSSSPTYEDAISGYEYFFLAPSGPITGVTMTDGVEFPIFSFENVGSCTGAMELFDNDNDPLANSPTLNFVNSMALVGGGFLGTEAYVGNYNAISADCGVSIVCSEGNYIDVIDVILIDPSECGLQDGSIEIVAVADGTNEFGPLQYGVQDANGLVWQTNNPLFPNKAAGDIFKLYVRHVGGYCQYFIGNFELKAPLAAIVTNITSTPADCGQSNGTVTITAVSNSGGPLQYGAGTPPVYQASNTLTGLPGGIHPIWVWDQQAGCQSLVASFLVEECVNVPCSNLDLENMGSGLYQVSLTAGQTINQPDDVTETMRITIKVPTGGFLFSNLTSQVTNVDFMIGTTTVAPTESPDYDYITVELATPNTDEIPYFANTKIPLFTFENGGICPGDSIYLLQMDDPYLISGADINHDISVSGVTLNDCIGEGVVECEVVPSDCDVTFEIDRLPAGEFRLSIKLDNVNASGLQAITGSTSFAIKVPAGGFQISNLTSLIDASFTSNLIVASPVEDPLFDYYNISQENSTQAGTSPNYVANQYVPFLTFENVGPCVSGEITLIDNDDPTAQAVAAGNNVSFGQFTSIFAVGPTIPACLSSNASVECQGDPCATLSPGFQAGLACEGATIDFTDTTTSNETIASWEWNFGDGSPTSNFESPSHIYSNSGNFEVSLTVTTNSGCEATYSEFVTVFSSPGVPAITSYVDCGTGIEISVPSADSIVWTPEDGLTPNPPTNEATVIAHPMVTTTYTVELISADGCSTSTEIEVIADNKPDWKDATPIPVSDCGLMDGQIEILATSSGDVEYSLDLNGPWFTNILITDLAAGDYNVFARNVATGCPVASPWNPVTVTGPISFTLDNIDVTDPTGCNDDGVITVTATGGNAPLQYSLVGVAGPQDSNVFSDLAEGTYTVEVTNADGSCLQSQTVSLTSMGVAPIIVDRVFDASICIDAIGSVSLTINENIQTVNITGGTFANQAIDGQTVTFDVDPVLGDNNFNVEIIGVSNCSVADVVSLIGTTAPTANFSSSPTLCTGGDVTLNFTGTASANATYQWSVGDGQITFDDGNGTVISTWASAGSKSVTLTVDDNSCQSQVSNSLNITEFDPGISLDVSNPSCNIGNDGSIDLTIAGAGNFAYQWVGPGVNLGTQDLNSLSGGTYQVTITDTDSNCSIESFATLTSPTGINISSTATDATECLGNPGDGSVAVTVNGGTSNYVYEIFAIANMNTPLESISVGNNSYTFDDLPAGAYSVVVTDASGCTDEATVAVQSVNSNVSATTSFTNADCAGANGSVTVNVTSGTAPYTFQYYNNNQLIGSGQVPNNTLDIGGVNSGSATVVITDASGCIGISSFAIGESDPAWLDDVTFNTVQPTCDADNGSIELVGVPTGSFVSWANYPTVIDPLIEDIGSGIYDVTIIDVNGCQGDLTITVNSTNGPEILITQENDPACGNADGGIVFQVNGGNSFEYEIIGVGVISGTGSPNTPIVIQNLAAGNWTIHISDLVNTNCESFDIFELEGGFDLGSSQTIVTLPSDCGVHDATINITVDYPDMLNISSDQGTVPDDFTTNVTITDLYEGVVNVTLTDELLGCSEVFQFTLIDQVEPEINAGDYTVTSFDCPGELGSITSNVANTEFLIYNDQDILVGITPYNAPMGNFTLRLVDGQCMAEEAIEVTGIPDFDVIVSVVNETCDGSDGALQIEVAGGTGPYTFSWPNNISSSDNANGLSSGNYIVTIQDAIGCSTTALGSVDAPSIDECDDNPCDFIFFTDTVYVNLTGVANKICLPTELDIAQFEFFNLNLNGNPFNANIDECGEKAVFYAYSSLMTYTPPPYRLEEWQNPGDHSPGFQFNNIDELIAKMNEVDPTGNWVNDEQQMIIVGGNPGSNYGSLVINHIQSNSTLSLEPNTIIVFNPSITVDDTRTHILIASDPNDPSCADTLYINLLTDGMPIPDTININIEVGEIWSDCLDVTELNGTPETLTSVCQSITNNAQWIASGTECIEIEGMDEGTDEFCIVICDDNGLCDTTYIFVNVTEGGNELKIFTAFSPNEDGVNDYFKIKNIERHPDNHLSVYNRWGNRVYKKDSYTNIDPWKAVYKNTALPDGTYFYVLDIDIDGVSKTMTGWVQVRR